MRSVLFVDDDESLLNGIRRVLRGERKDWQMQFAIGGEQALAAFSSGAFDVIVSDLRMPQMDGAVLLSLIRDQYPSTARIVLSGFSDDALLARASSVAHRCLAKPCEPAALVEAMNRIGALQAILDLATIRSAVGTVNMLPSPSSTLTVLLKKMDESSTTVDELAELIETDIALSAKVLQLANNAFFGLSRQVESLKAAALHLGINTLRNVVLASQAFFILKPRSNATAAILEPLQRHSSMVAAIARTLPCGQGLRDTTLLAASLHDIGRLFLASFMPQQYATACSLCAAGDLEPFEAEAKVVGGSHAEIGAYLLGLWGIPLPIVEAIARHHHPACERHSPLECADIVYCADLLAHEIEAHPGDDRGDLLNEHHRDNLRRLGLLDDYPLLRENAIRAVRFPQIQQ